MLLQGSDMEVPIWNGIAAADFDEKDSVYSKYDSDLEQQALLVLFWSTFADGYVRERRSDCVCDYVGGGSSR